MYVRVILRQESKWYKILKRKKNPESNKWVEMQWLVTKKMPRKRRDLGSALEDSSLIVYYEA